jgi:flagellin
MAAYGGSAQIDTATDHLFETGDIVTYEQGPAASSIPIPGLEDGKSYKVTVVDSDSFSLTNLDGTTINYGALAIFGTPSNAKFHLQSISAAPTVGLSKASYSSTGGAEQAAPASEVLKTEDIMVHGHVGSSEVQLRTGMTALEIANAVSNQDSLTGVRASAVTNARLTVSPSNNTDDKHVIAFDLYGMNTDSPVKVSATIGFGTGDEVHSADLTDLRDKINGFTGTTGIYAKLSSDKSYSDIKSPDGYDVVIDNVDMPTDTGKTLTQALVNATKAATSNTIETVADHGFQVGDMVKLTQVYSESGIVGIDMETTYFVKTAPTPKTFTLATGSPDGTTVNITTANNGKLEFTKLEKTLNLQSLDRDLKVKGGKVKLMDKDIELQGSGVGAVMTSVAASGPAADITCTNEHRLEVGDIVKYTKGTTLITGLVDGQFYKVKTDVSATAFELENVDGTAVTYGGPGAGGTFSKVIPNENSLRLTGEVQFESAYTFTVVPAVQDSLFRAAPPAANLNKVSDLDVLTVEKSHKFLTALDGAIKRIDAERGDLGATMNRMQHTIDNLSNVIVGTKSARGRIEDADMAAETASLAKNQILQQAATAMLGQANQSMQTILTLLR